MPPATSLPLAQRRSLVDSTIDLIRAEIEDGRWKVGDRIPNESELANALQVGRNTVREAVRVLSHAKVLEVRQGDGTYVRLSVDPAEVMRRVTHAGLRDHFELRAMLETEAARMAALRRTDEDMTRLADLLEKRGDLPHEPDLDGFVERDAAFHLAVAQATQNSALAELYRFFSVSVRQNTSAALADVQLPEPGLAAHQRLLDAIRRQDAEGAAQAAQAIVAPVIEALAASRSA
ncbi:GntR family transcriptional regulator [Xaviernesmea oryzae]|uniref:GntR family transcriptional regulator n=1 Tax=Xaviernesmea oryzae TaxID=464029 RepID=A0A1Q9AYV8_9HYPH|nr:FCD domain-containing protein [Xaviernesmea oryzae]OLP60600.1 GntR family transcriptional regulator [Xaviernesmea oryzae]SEM32750.1 DNA-binding transcriptional regulator, FadR family [Xaviernesmea oryzae]